MEMEDYLGKAANEKQSAKIAIKEKRFDDAWRHLNNQKILYLQHAHRMHYSAIHRLVLESSPHEDMANILRLEGKHKNALSNMSYTYKAAYTASRPIITLEKKLEAYYNRAYKRQPFNRFLSLLKVLPNSDYVSVRDFVEKFFPLAPDLGCENDQASLGISTPNQELHNKEAKSHVDPIRSNSLGTQSPKVSNQAKATRLIHGVVLLKSPIQEWMVKNVFDWNTSYFAELDKNKPLLYQCPEISKDINKLSGTDQAIFWRTLNQYFSESNKRDNEEGAMNPTTKNLSCIDNLKSPITNEELLKIDIYIKDNIKFLSELSFEYYENIRLFQPKIINFDQYLVKLTPNEKTRAWFYLFSNAKKARENFRKQRVGAEINPSYKFITSDPVSQKLDAQKVIGGIVLLVSIVFISYLFLTKDSDYDKCVANGIQYYKDIDSYPMLKSENISADQKVKENCKRSNVAF